jgi:hypothetical protein
MSNILQNSEGNPELMCIFTDDSHTLFKIPSSVLGNFRDVIFTYTFLHTFHTNTLLLHLDIIKFFFYSPTDAQVNCLRNNLKIYIKIYFKTAPTCFGVVTPSSGRALFELANVTVVKIIIIIIIIIIINLWGGEFTDN